MARLVVCLDCRREISRAARACPNCGRPRSRSLAKFIIKALIVVPLLFFVLIFVVGRMLTGDNPHRGVAAPPAVETYEGTGQAIEPIASAPVASPAPAPDFGPAVLRRDNGPWAGVWLAMSESDWADLIIAEQSVISRLHHGGAKLTRMAESGRARIYGNDTPVNVVKGDGDWRYVEVTDGEDAGKAGWAKAEFVHPRELGPVAGSRLQVGPESDAAYLREQPPTPGRGESVAPAPGKSQYDRMQEEAAQAAIEYRNKQSKRAESMIQSAMNLERMGKLPGARNFYREIIKDYADTPQAEVASQRLKALTADKPAP